MVLEILVKPKEVTGKAWEMYFIGIVYSLFAVGLSYWVFKNYVSLIMVSLTAIAAIPFIHRAIELEESKERKFARRKHKRIWKAHRQVISMFTFLFLGYVTVFTILYISLPSQVVGDIFQSQIETIVTIHSSSTPTGNFLYKIGNFGQIFLNNFKILFLCLVFSFFYGVGAIFILSWNASVMGVAIGSAIRQGINTGSGIIQAISLNLLGYFVHGIPEIIAYFIAGLAGGIISVGLVQENFMSKNFKKIAKDCGSLILFSVVLLIVAGLIEVFLSPSLLS